MVGEADSRTILKLRWPWRRFVDESVLNDVVVTMVRVAGSQTIPKVRRF